jgi:hypothetical protein
MTSDINKSCYESISTFIKELNTWFGKTNKPLRLYSKLISKTHLAHPEAVEKHIKAFRIFCKSNHDAIVNEISENIVGNIVYSETCSRIYIDISGILKSTDPETVKVILNHLLFISALVDPNGKARDTIKKNKNTTEKSSPPDFLKDIMSKVGDAMSGGNSGDSTSSIMNLMTSLPNLLSGMQNGFSEDSIKGLIETATDMMSTLRVEGKDDLNINSTLDSLKDVMDSSSNSKTPPDMSSIMSMISKLGSSTKNAMPEINKSDVVRNEDVCNEDVCNEDVCNKDVCNKDVCNKDVCNKDVCNEDVCNKDVCNDDVCNDVN